MKRLLRLLLLTSLLCLALCVSASAVSAQAEDYAVSNIRWEGQELVWDPPAAENVTYQIYAVKNPLRPEPQGSPTVLLGASDEPGTILLPSGRLCKYTDIAVATLVDGVEMARVTAEGLILSGASFREISCIPHFKVLSDDRCLLTLANLPANAHFQLFLSEDESDTAPPVIKTGYTDEYGFVIDLPIQNEALPDLIEYGFLTVTVCSSVRISDDGNTLSCSVREVQCNSSEWLHRNEEFPAVWIRARSDKSATATLYRDGRQYDSIDVLRQNFNFTVLEDGTYDLAFSAPGCLTHTVTGIPVEQGEDDLYIDLGAVPWVAGDTNGDDMINIMDMGAFRKDFGKNLTGIGGVYTDVNNDNLVNIMDMGIFRQNFGKTAAKDCTVPYSE